MVSGLTIAAMAFSMVVPILFFLVFLIRFFRKYKTGWRPVLIGAGIFLLFAMVLEGLFNRYLLIWNGSTAAFFRNNVLAYCLIGGINAGVFEETGRLFGFRMFFRDRRDWKNGVAYGIGHGGIELLYIGGGLALTYFNYINYAVRINGGTFDELKKLVPSKASELDLLKQALVGTPSATFLAGGAERVMAFLFHIAASLLVLYAVKNRRYLFYVLAVAIHALSDFLTSYTAKTLGNIWFSEGILLLFAIASVIFIIKSRRLFSEAGQNANPQEQDRI